MCARVRVPVNTRALGSTHERAPRCLDESWCWAPVVRVDGHAILALVRFEGVGRKERVRVRALELNGLERRLCSVRGLEGNAQLLEPGQAGVAGN